MIQLNSTKGKGEKQRGNCLNVLPLLLDLSPRFLGDELQSCAGEGKSFDFRSPRLFFVAGFVALVTD